MRARVVVLTIGTLFCMYGPVCVAWRVGNEAGTVVNDAFAAVCIGTTWTQEDFLWQMFKLSPTKRSAPSFDRGLLVLYTPTVWSHPRSWRRRTYHIWPSANFRVVYNWRLQLS